MRARSAITGAPDGLWPRASGSLASESRNASDSSSVHSCIPSSWRPCRAARPSGCRRFSTPSEERIQVASTWRTSGVAGTDVGSSGAVEMEKRRGSPAARTPGAKRRAISWLLRSVRRSNAVSRPASEKTGSGACGGVPKWGTGGSSTAGGRGGSNGGGSRATRCSTGGWAAKKGSRSRRCTCRRHQARDCRMPGGAWQIAARSRCVRPRLRMRAKVPAAKQKRPATAQERSGFTLASRPATNTRPVSPMSPP